jgi:hypothetical protein
VNYTINRNVEEEDVVSTVVGRGLDFLEVPLLSGLSCHNSRVTRSGYLNVDGT